LPESDEASGDAHKAATIELRLTIWSANAAEARLNAPVVRRAVPNQGGSRIRQGKTCPEDSATPS
jgi:hypothetical protein